MVVTEFKIGKCRYDIEAIKYGIKERRQSHRRCNQCTKLRNELSNIIESKTDYYLIKRFIFYFSHIYETINDYRYQLILWYQFAELRLKLKFDENVESIIIEYLFHHVEPIKRQFEKWLFYNSFVSKKIHFKILNIIQSFIRNAKEASFICEFDPNLLYWMTKIYGKENFFLENQDECFENYMLLIASDNIKKENENFKKMSNEIIGNFSHSIKGHSTNCDKYDMLDDLNSNISKVKTVNSAEIKNLRKKQALLTLKDSKHEMINNLLKTIEKYDEIPQMEIQTASEKLEEVNLMEEDCLLNEVIFFTIFFVCFTIRVVQSLKLDLLRFSKLFKNRASQICQSSMHFIYQTFNELSFENFTLDTIPQIPCFENDAEERLYSKRIYKKRKKFSENFIFDLCFKRAQLLFSNVDKKNFQKVKIDSKHIKWFSSSYQNLKKFYEQLKAAGTWNKMNLYIYLICICFGGNSNYQYQDFVLSSKIDDKKIFEKQGFTPHQIMFANFS